MKRLKPTYVLQDSTTKQPKMFKAMTVEESQDANALLKSYGSPSQWVQHSGMVIEAREVLKVQEAA